MQELRKEIQRQLTQVLAPIGLDVLSFVPDDHAKPFIYIGDIETQQMPNKSQFELQGTYNVELFTGTQSWVGSLDLPLTYLSNMKLLLQPMGAYVLDLNAIGVGMVRQHLFNDTGLFSVSPTERLYSAILQYEFETTQNQTYFDRVIADGGILEAMQCVLQRIITLQNG